MLAILLIVLFHAEGDRLPAAAEPAISGLDLQPFIAERAGKHGGIPNSPMILRKARDTV